MCLKLCKTRKNPIALLVSRRQTHPPYLGGAEVYEGWVWLRAELRDILAVEPHPSEWLLSTSFIVSIHCLSI